MDMSTTHQPDGEPKSVRGLTGFTPICPAVVGTMPLLWSPEETAGRMRQKKVAREIEMKECMV